MFQELKPKPGDIRPKLLENMALIATKQKQNVEKALSSFMDLTVDEVWFYESVRVLYLFGYKTGFFLPKES